VRSLRIVSLFLVLAAGTPVRAQDVPKLRKESLDAEARVGRDRLDLRLSPPGLPTLTEEDRKRASLGFRTDLDADFACGRFDIKASFQSIFSKHAREEFLDATVGSLEGMLVGNTMELLCETSPTLCQLIQHYRMATNAMLTMEYDRCRAIEGAVDNAQKRIAASALKSCMEAEAARGVPLDEAQRKCQQSDSVRGLMGDKVAKFDMVDELTKQFGLKAEDAAALKKTGQDLTYDGKRISGVADAASMTRRYDELRTGYADAWSDAVDLAGRGEAPPAEQTAKLLPAGSPVVTTRELEEIAALPPFERKAVIDSVAGAAALLAFTAEIQKVEQILEAARQLPKVDREEIGTRLERLRAERARITERFEQEARLRKALLDAAAVSAAGARRRVGDVLVDRQMARHAADFKEGTRPFSLDESSSTGDGGSSNRTKPAAPPREGSSCGSGCGGSLEYRFGGGD